MMEFSSDIDYLFEESQMDTVFSFENLPAELRNRVYEYSLPKDQILVDGQSYPVALRINKHAEFVVLAFTGVSRQLRYETLGYVDPAITRAITQTDGLIYAQIMDYDHRPLQNRLDQLSKEHAIPKATLASRVVVTFVGELNVQNILTWIEDHLKNPEETPLFRVANSNNLPRLDGFDEISVLTGSLSLTPIIGAFHSPHVSQSRWKNSAQAFLNDLELLHISHVILPRHQDMELSTRVFKTFISCHELLQRHKDALPAKDVGTKRRRLEQKIRSELSDVAQVMNCFQYMVGW